MDSIQIVGELASLGIGKSGNTAYLDREEGGERWCEIGAPKIAGRIALARRNVERGISMAFIAS